MVSVCVCVWRRVGVCVFVCFIQQIISLHSLAYNGMACPFSRDPSNPYSQIPPPRHASNAVIMMMPPLSLDNYFPPLCQDHACNN